MKRGGRVEQSVSCPRASRDAPLIPSKGRTVLVGAADPLELLQAVSARKTPDNGNQAEV